MRAEFITSVANQKVKKLTALQKKAKLRREEQTFIIEGERLFRDTPARFVREIFVTEEFLIANEKLVSRKLAETERAVPVTVLTQAVFEKVSATQTPQGVMCAARMPSYEMKDLMGSGKNTAAPLLLILENIQDPGNLGTIFRTAEAAGATGILMSEGTADLFNPKTVRATMSAIFRMPFVYTRDLTGDIVRLRDEGVQVYAAHLGAKKAYDEYDYRGASAFLIGNEGNGLTDAAAGAASHRLLIPMQGEIESLNAAMAAGILAYEASRQRRNPEA